jgi:D-amino peptidase
VRILIASDMEGVSGIVKWEQVEGGEPLYEEGRKLYTEEINAAVRGAKAAGATEIVVMDCHGAGKGWTFNSLVPELLDPDCEWVVQDEWSDYTGALEAGCDAALLVGMHAKAGSARGVMSHTVSGRDYRELRFNGVSVGETGINAALCGVWSCPVVLVTGDDVVCEEATELLGAELVTVQVKEGLGRFSARNVPPVRARALIEAGAQEAIAKRGRVPPYDPGSPCEIEVTFASPDLTEKYRYRHGVELATPLTILSRADDWLTAWRQFFF